jgi:phosphate transport system permease protein
MSAQRARRSADRWVKGVAGVFAGSTLFFVLAVVLFLALDSYPSVVYNGLHFLTGTVWNLGNVYGGGVEVHGGVHAPEGASYGVLPLILGTLLTSVIALVLAVPTAVGVAILLTEYLPPWLTGVLSFLVELLAGVPSVVYGLWGFIVLIPWIGGSFGPAVARALGGIPFLAGPVGSGQGLLASGVVLALMVVPIIAVTTRDLLRQTPLAMKEGALALGSTRWEMVRSVCLPWAASGILGAVILGLGRALGETMAVLMVSGNAINLLPQNLYSSVGTLAATIVSQLDSAMTDPTGMAVHALAEAALVLFLITVAVNIPARLLVARQSRREGESV